MNGVHLRSSAVSSDLHRLHVEISACRKCVEAGFFAQTSPIVVNQPIVERPHMMLVGQAPASPLRSKGKPFSGQAGRILFKWLARAGFTEEEFRAQCYFTAITKCYPGPANVSPSGVGGKGDRVPTAKERALCEPFLLRELAWMGVGMNPAPANKGRQRRSHRRDKPVLILTVGRVAATYFLGSDIDFTHAIGETYPRDDYIVLPLPHPSGVSRWTNDSNNQARLNKALRTLKSLAHGE
jgi:uracil-DNA glycosylase